MSWGILLSPIELDDADFAIYLPFSRSGLLLCAPFFSFIFFVFVFFEMVVPGCMFALFQLGQTGKMSR